MRILRAALFKLFFYALTTILCVTGGIPVLLFARRHSLSLARFWIRLVLAGARIICGIRIEVTGLQHLPVDGGAVLACQHQSAVDTLLWFTILPRPSYVMKRELTRIPVFGSLLLGAGMIPVSRDAGAQALRGLLEATSRMIAQGRQIVIFPEGTRVRPGERVPLQPGVAAVARRAGLPVVPVALDSGRYWGRGFLDMWPGTIHVAVHPPIPPGTQRVAMLGAVENVWLKEAGRRASDGHAYTVDKSGDGRSAQAGFTSK